MILICGSSFDPVIRFLRARWDSEHLAYCVLDLARVDGNPGVQLDWKDRFLDGFIGGENRPLELSELTGVFFRNSSCRAEKGASSSFAECDPEIAAVLNNLPCRVANRPVAGMSNRSKPFQALQIRECGFRIPETLVTNDPAAAKQFYEQRDGKVIFKSISGVRSIVRRLGPEYLERLPLLRNGPAQFQAFVAGDDIRVHVVGDLCFDYRFAWQDGIPLKMEPTMLSAEVTSQCLRLSQKLGLSLAGIDLKESPTGEYYCFEVNAAPMFSFYERTTCQSISTALGEFLRQPPTPTESMTPEDSDGEYLT
jgi:glutathione synthase/RimK-type ligase-like ATP-grasp enzyme